MWWSVKEEGSRKMSVQRTEESCSRHARWKQADGLLIMRLKGPKVL